MESARRRILIAAKGPFESVRIRSQKYGLCGLELEKELTQGELLATAPATEENIQAVIEWFVGESEARPPYPEGSVLWYEFE